MNFKTTLILIVLLGAAGVYLISSRNDGEQSVVVKPEIAPLLGIDSADVNKLSITQADGSVTTFEKNGGDWKMTAPVSAPAEKFEVDGLIRQITELKSHGSNEPSSVTGLDKPAYTIELTTSAGKTQKLLVGQQSAVGNTLYVQREGQKQVDLVDAAIIEKLEKKSDDYRSKQLTKVTSDQVKVLEISRPDGKLSFEKHGSDWKMKQPTAMSAEGPVVDEMLSAVTGLRAVEFVNEPSADLAGYGLTNPKTSISFSTDAPATQPAATQPTMTTIAIGRYDDIRKANVFATIVGSNTVVKIPASSIETLNKKPIEFRDKRVVHFEPEEVVRLTLAINRSATTQPTTRSSSTSTVMLQRREETALVGPSAPTTGPATQPSTRPSPSKWIVAEEKKDADDAAVDAILADLHPLRAEKFVESLPIVVNFANTYVLTVQVEPRGKPPIDHQIIIRERNETDPLVATYDGTHFELSRDLLTKLGALEKK